MRYKQITKGILFMTLVLLLLLPSSIHAQQINNMKPVDKQIVKETSEIKQAGTYFIRMDGNEETEEDYSELVRIHVKYPKTVLNYSKEEGIDAHDVVVLPGELSKLSDQEIIKFANAHAWSMDTGAQINELNVSINKPEKHKGTVANVVYSTKDNTSVQVNVFEQDEINLGLDELYMNQSTVLKDSIRTLSSVVIIIVIIPTIIFLLVFTRIRKETKKVNELLQSSSS